VTHLNDEQFEEALRAPADQSGHLAECSACRHRLEDMRAVRGRLQSAFASVAAPSALAERIQAAASGSGETTTPSAPVSARRPLILRLRRYAWPMAAAAAILALAVPLVVFLSGPSSVQAAQQELVNIHRQNLAEGHSFYSEDEPEKLAQYFKEKLGFAPAMPKLNQGMAIRGCCIAHFREEPVGSYVVDTPHGVVSIIVVTDQPSSLGLTRKSGHAGQPVWEGNLGMCNMAAVRMGDYTYAAVAEVPQHQLTQLLGLLVQ
jgi:anti-sigma factor RsiW